MAETNKIIVTGLALAADADPEICQSCNFDISWIFQYPSTLLWADSIILTPTIMSVIDKGYWSEFAESERKPIGDIVRLFFDKAGENGLVEIRDPAKDVDETARIFLRDKAENDREILSQMLPSAVTLDEDEKVPGGMRIENQHFCTPRILSIYYSLLLAKIWGAEPLLNEHTFTYLKYALGTHGAGLAFADQSLQTFQEVFREQLPEIDIRPHLGERNCWNCAHGNDCDKEELRQIKKRLHEYLNLRDYDEVAQMKELFSELAAKCRARSEEDFPRQVEIEFQKTQKRLRRRLHRTFPLATRWTNLVTILSIPVAVAGIVADSALVGGLGAGMAGLSEMTKRYMEVLASKHRWLCFRQGRGTDLGPDV